MKSRCMFLRTLEYTGSCGRGKPVSDVPKSEEEGYETAEQESSGLLLALLLDGGHAAGGLLRGQTPRESGTSSVSEADRR